MSTTSQKPKIERRMSWHLKLDELSWTRPSVTNDDILMFLKDIGETDAFLGRDDDDDTNRPLSRDRILQKIREKKEVMGKLRSQPWNMRRKRRTLKLAQKYLEKHESRVSKSHLYKEELNRRWNKFSRWLSNVSIYLIPWESKIKTIESHFGSVVSSYFTFLRWIFWVNFMITCLMTVFIVVPECLGDAAAAQDMNNTRKHLSNDELDTADHLQTLWDFKGYLSVTPLFYGFYSNNKFVSDTFKYQLPLAYFLVNLCVLGYSFFAVLRKMAANARMSKLASGKTEQYVFCWKLFTGWDYTIGNSETASNTVMATVNKLRESIAEYRVKLRTKFICLRFLLRILANALILGLIGMSAWVIFAVVERSKNLHKMTNVGTFRHNEVPIVVSFITLVFPNMFEIIGTMERYHPRTALRLQLGRVLILYVLNYYTLIFALFNKLSDQENPTQALNRNKTARDFENEARAQALQGLPNLTALEYVYNDKLYPVNDNSGLIFNFTEPHFTRRKRSNILLKELLLFFNYQSTSETQTSQSTKTNLLTTTSTSLSELPLQHSGIPSRNPRKRFEYKSTTRQQKRDLTSTIQFADSSVSQSTSTLESSPPFKNVSDTVGLILLNSSDTLGPQFTTESHQTTTPIPTVSSSTVAAFFRENVSDIEINMLAAGEIIPKLLANHTDNATKYVQLEPGGPFETTIYDPNEGRVTGVPVEDGQRYRYDKLTEGDNEELDCWENMIGQEISKIILTDLVMNVAAIVVVDFLRGLWVRYCSIWWCWNLETTFPEYGEFKVAENVLHIINNQGMIWLGMFFAPLLPAMNNIKLIVLMYIRAWAVMTCNVPAQQIFRASRSSNFYLMLLLLMLFLCTLPVGYVIASRTPSTKCGPFSGKGRFYHILTDKLGENLSPQAMARLEYIASPGVVIPILVLLILVIYFLVSLVRGLREANDDLQKQLLHERTDEKRKIYQLAGGGKESVAQDVHNTDMPNTTIVDLSFLPQKERRRREPWYQKEALLDDETQPFLNRNNQEPDSDEDEAVDSIDRQESVSMRSGSHGTILTNNLLIPGARNGLRSPRSRSPGLNHSLKTLQEESTQESAAPSELDEISVRSRSESNIGTKANSNPVGPSIYLAERGFSQVQSSPGNYGTLLESATDHTEDSELPITTDDEVAHSNEQQAPLDSGRSWPTPRTPEGIREYLLEEPSDRVVTPQFPETIESPRYCPPKPSRLLSDSTSYDNQSEGLISPRSMTMSSPDAFNVTPLDLQKMISPTEFATNLISSAASSLKKPFTALREWSNKSNGNANEVPMVPLEQTSHTDETEVTGLEDTDAGEMTFNDPRPAYKQRSVERAMGPMLPSPAIPEPKTPQVLTDSEMSDSEMSGNDSGAEASTEEVKGVNPTPKPTKLIPRPIHTAFTAWPSPAPGELKELKKVSKSRRHI